MVRSRFLPLVVLLVACGDAVSTGGGSGDAGAQDAAQDAAAVSSYQAAMEAACARAPLPITEQAMCPATWPTGPTRAPRIGAWGGGILTTIEEYFSPDNITGIPQTPAQRALVASCDASRIPIPRGERCTRRGFGDCVDLAISTTYLDALRYEVVRTGRCW